MNGPKGLMAVESGAVYTLQNDSGTISGTYTYVVDSGVDLGK